jgi:hypothetical protein
MRPGADTQDHLLLILPSNATTRKDVVMNSGVSVNPKHNNQCVSDERFCCEDTLPGVIAHFFDIGHKFCCIDPYPDHPIGPADAVADKECCSMSVMKEEDDPEGFCCKPGYVIKGGACS